MVDTTRSHRYQSGFGIPGGIGIREENIHTGSGLRTATVVASITQPPVVANRLRQIYAGATLRTSIGDAANETASSGVWVSLTPKTPGGIAFANPRLPVPMTPTIIQVILTLDLGPSKTRFRVSGLDQFGNRIVEVTPWIIDAGWGLTSYFTAITLSKVFSYIDDFEYQGQRRTDIPANAQLNPEFTQFGMGYHAAPDPTQLEGATALNPTGLGITSLRYLDTEANWGIGSPLRLSPYNVAAPYRFSELIGASAVLLRESETPAIINTATAFPVYGSFAKAVGTLTFTTGLVTTGSTVTIGTRVYTWRTTLTASSPVNEVLIGATRAESAFNLHSAINGAAGAGSLYSGGTTPHPLVDSHAWTSGADPTVLVRSRTAGYEGNTIVTTETDANTAWGAVTLLEGAPTAGVVLGRSLAGWEGCAHKIGFRSSDNWATQVLGIELGGNSGAVPATMTTALRDEIEFMFTVRSSLGTMRDSGSASGYER